MEYKASSEFLCQRNCRGKIKSPGPSPTDKPVPATSPAPAWCGLKYTIQKSPKFESNHMTSAQVKWLAIVPHSKRPGPMRLFCGE